MASDPQPFDRALREATALHRQGRLTESFAHLRRALALRPDHLLAQNLQGLLLASEERLDEALAHFEHLLEGNPRVVPLRLNAALVALRGGKQSRAIEHLLRVVDLDPAHQRAFGYLALLHLLRGELDLARGALLEAGLEDLARALEGERGVVSDPAFRRQLERRVLELPPLAAPPARETESAPGEAAPLHGLAELDAFGPEAIDALDATATDATEDDAPEAIDTLDAIDILDALDAPGDDAPGDDAPGDDATDAPGADAPENDAPGANTNEANTTDAFDALDALDAIDALDALEATTAPDEPPAEADMVPDREEPPVRATAATGVQPAPLEAPAPDEDRPGSPPLTLLQLARQTLPLEHRGALATNADDLLLLRPRADEGAEGALLRSDRVLLARGALSWRGAARRRKGREQGLLLCEGHKLMRVEGEGQVMLHPGPGNRLEILDLSDEAIFVVDRHLLACSSALALESGRIPTAGAEGPPLLYLSGTGFLALALPGRLRAVAADEAAQLWIRADVLLGWTPGTIPREARRGKSGLVIGFEGQGMVLLAVREDRHGP